ncbi:hypothetical protein C364_06982 [Cryptococcus neoformans Bt63]|nr:hypothetical protein C364_06982 [Cryptococcus neoformans var. grubii Bt63]
MNSFHLKVDAGWKMITSWTPGLDPRVRYPVIERKTGARMAKADDLFHVPPEGLSIDETQSLFEDGFGVKKSQIMLREKQEFASELRNRIGPSA